MASFARRTSTRGSDMVGLLRRLHLRDVIRLAAPLARLRVAGQRGDEGLIFWTRRCPGRGEARPCRAW